MDLDVEAFDDTRLEVIMMCGLPGAGKDRWIAEHATGCPVISLDAIRREPDIDPADNQGTVAAKAKELARGHLRQGQPFVWNATNTTWTMRRQLIGLLTNYHARVRVVYVETAWHELLRRNCNRSTPVPETVLRHLAEKLEVPNVTQAHQVEYQWT
jgi:predicted kinase